MRKYIILWVLLLCLSLCFSAEASTGSLDIVVSENEDLVFTYAKVADYINGEFVLKEELQNCKIDLNALSKGADVKNAVEILQACDLERIEFKEENVLDEGVYLIEGESEKYVIPAALVSIPQWDTEDELSYQVTMFPKMERMIEPVETGDECNLIPLVLLCMLSLTIVLGISGRAYLLKDK